MWGSQDPEFQAYFYLVATPGSFLPHIETHWPDHGTSIVCLWGSLTKSTTPVVAHCGSTRGPFSSHGSTDQGGCMAVPRREPLVGVVWMVWVSDLVPRGLHSRSHVRPMWHGVTPVTFCVGWWISGIFAARHLFHAWSASKSIKRPIKRQGWVTWGVNAAAYHICPIDGLGLETKGLLPQSVWLSPLSQRVHDSFYPLCSPGFWLPGGPGGVEWVMGSSGYFAWLR